MAFQGLLRVYGRYLGPVVKAQLSTWVQDETGQPRVLGRPLPEGGMRFAAGFASGACTALATQWMHNVSLFAGGA